ncbi:MAG: glycosyltransferase family 39 protein [Acidobacteria bacterium]|nr:glycosyltransferase family 39 protein [Acidobacteriota bacterium]
MAAAGEGLAPGASWLDAALLAFATPLAATIALAGQFVLSQQRGLYRSLVPGAALLGLALLLLIFALGRRRPVGGALPDRAAADGPAARRLPARVEWVLVALVLAGGLHLRLYRVDLVPWGLNNDEAINAIEAQEIAAGKPLASLTVRGLNRETMFHYLAAFSFKFAGMELNLLRAMPAVFGLSPRLVQDPLMDLVFPPRAVAIVAGALTLLALYLFARDRFGWRVALLAMAFLAVSPWHLLYSRVGERAVLAPLFAIATIGFFLKALDSGRMRDHVAWSVFLGLGFWGYTSFRAVPIALAAFVLLRRPLGWTAGHAGDPRARRAALAAIGIAAGILLVLMLLSPIGIMGFLTRGAYATLISPKANFPLNVFCSLGLAHHFPGRYAVIRSEAFISDGMSATYGLIGLAPETTVVAALSALGLVYAAWRALRRKDAACGLLVLCFLALVLTVGVAGPSLTRMLPNAPWVCLFAALFASLMVSDLAAIRPPLTAWAGGLLIVPLLAWSCAQGFANHFLRAGKSEQAMEHFGATQTIMGMFVRALPPDRPVYVLHTLRVDTLRYLIGDRPNVYLISDPSAFDLDGVIKTPKTTTFIIEFARPFAEAMRYLIMRYPLGDATQIADARFDPDKVIFYTFTLWKDESGQAVPAPDAYAPGAMPPGTPPPGVPPLGAPPPGAPPGG